MNVGIEKSIVWRLGQLKFSCQLCTSQTESPGVKYLTFVVVNYNIWLIRSSEVHQEQQKRANVVCLFLTVDRTCLENHVVTESHSESVRKVAGIH